MRASAGGTICDIAIESRDVLGEAPFWSVPEQALYWVDIRAPALYRHGFDGSPTRAWRFQELIGCFVPCARGGFLVGLKSGFHDFDPDSGALALIGSPEPHLPKNRINDGRCDPQGRFWAGTMQDYGGVPAGSLYRIASDRTWRKVFSDIMVPNGLAWSPDGRTMYFADSGRDRILAFPFDPDAGALGEPRLFADTASHPGKPDGAAVDCEGCLWSAEYGAGRVVRYAPDGRIDRVVAFPVTQVTACTFGGAGLDTLFVTSARQKLDEAALARQPHAGAVFALRPGVGGRPDVAFAG